MSVNTSMPFVATQIATESKLWCRICTPAQLYIILTVIAIIALAVKKQFMSIPYNLLFALVYTFLLNWLCDKGWTNMSWILVIVPFVAMLIVVGVLLYAEAKNKLNQKKTETKK
jgi:uncharacterized membrane protein YhaH (DUF805 family)